MDSYKEKPTIYVPRTYIADSKGYINYIARWYKIYNPILFNCDLLGKNVVLEAINELKDKAEYPFTLQMERVDLDFIEKAHDILGDKLRIAPTQGQERRVSRYELDYYDLLYPEYTYEEIIEKERVFDLYTKSVEDYYDKDGDIKSLSPLEKFIAAWTIATRIALYKIEPGFPDDRTLYHTSRSIYEIVGKNENVSIVCTGFVRILRELLYRMGLKDTISMSFRLDGERNGHEVMLIHLVDPKYDINGIYMCDPASDANGIKDSRYNNMLRSHDSIKFAYLNEYEFNFKEQEGHNGKATWKMYGKLNVDNPDELYNKPIPGDSIVYARLALDHFLDKERKMVKDNSEYDVLDIMETAYRLNIGDVTVIKNIAIEKIYQSSIKLSFKDLDNYYSYFVHQLMDIIKHKIKEEINADNVINILKDKDKDKDKEIFRLSLTLPREDKELVDEFKKYWPSSYIDFCGNPQINIYDFDDRPIEDQISDITKAYKKFESDYSKIASEKRENGVK